MYNYERSKYTKLIIQLKFFRLKTIINMPSQNKETRDKPDRNTGIL